MIPKPTDQKPDMIHNAMDVKVFNEGENMILPLAPMRAWYQGRIARFDNAIRALPKHHHAARRGLREQRNAAMFRLRAVGALMVNGHRAIKLDDDQNIAESLFRAARTSVPGWRTQFVKNTNTYNAPVLA